MGLELGFRRRLEDCGRMRGLSRITIRILLIFTISIYLKVTQSETLRK